MNQTARGLVIFVSALVTITFWAPLANAPRLGLNGGTITDTFFGIFRYATMHAVMKEPDFTMTWSVDPKRLALTAAVTVLFWGFVIWFLRRRKPFVADRAEA